MMLEQNLSALRQNMGAYGVGACNALAKVALGFVVKGRGAARDMLKVCGGNVSSERGGAWRGGVFGLHGAAGVRLKPTLE